MPAPFMKGNGRKMDLGKWGGIEGDGRSRMRGKCSWDIMYERRINQSTNQSVRMGKQAGQVSRSNQ